MPLASFLHVLTLLGIIAYFVLLTLENPSFIHLPLPFGQGEWLVSSGAAIILAGLVGGFYTAILLLPIVLREKLRYSRIRKEQQTLQRQLAATLQARVANTPLSDEQMGSS